MPTCKAQRRNPWVVLGFGLGSPLAMPNCHNLFSRSPLTVTIKEMKGILFVSESAVLVSPEVYQVAQAARHQGIKSHW